MREASWRACKAERYLRAAFPASQGYRLQVDGDHASQGSPNATASVGEPESKGLSASASRANKLPQGARSPVNQESRVSVRPLRGRPPSRDSTTSLSKLSLVLL